jgi:ABC-2 type transport system ATP-binding protein
VDVTGLKGVHDLVVRGDEVTFDVDSERLDAAIGALHARGLRSLVAHPPTLEQLFLRHYGEELAELGAEA